MDNEQSPQATGSFQDKLFKTQSDLEFTNQSIRDLVNQRRQAALLLRGTGYALLLITLILYVSFFIPLRFGNPTWQLELIGGLVQNVAFPLVGVTLVFYGGKNWRTMRELLMLRGFSYALLVVALAYFMLLPLGLSSTVRLFNQSQAQVGAGLDQRMGVLQQLETKIQSATSDQELNNVLGQLQGQPKLPENIDPTTAKQQLLGQLAQAKSNLKSKAEAIAEQQQFSLIKNFIQQSFMAIIATGIFAWLWWRSSWARFRRSL